MDEPLGGSMERATDRTPQASPADILELLGALLTRPPRGPRTPVPRQALQEKAHGISGAATAGESGNCPDAATSAGIIDVSALRRAVGSIDPVSVGADGALHETPGHIEHAKRVYLATLIDELGGDLSLIARYWDRSSEKTIRKLVRRYGLTGELEAARRSGPLRGADDAARLHGLRRGVRTTGPAEGTEDRGGGDSS